MKKILTLLPALLFAFTLVAQPPKVEAERGMIFGDKVTEQGAVKATELHTFLAGKEATPVKVEGKVTEVCKAQGSWLRMETASGTMLVKMKDHKFLVPLSLHGKTLVADGVASMKETSVDMLRHYAEDAGKPKEETHTYFLHHGIKLNILSFDLHASNRNEFENMCNSFINSLMSLIEPLIEEE